LLRADIARRRDDGRSKEATRRNLPREEIKSRLKILEDAEKAKTMKINNCRYMKNAEFKARQTWLDFVDAVGVALKIMAEVKENSAAWLKKWIKNFKIPTAKRVAPLQDVLELVIATDILKWADWTPAKNYELELKTIEIAIKKEEKILTWAQLKELEKEFSKDQATRKQQITNWIEEKNKRVEQDSNDYYKEQAKKIPA
jgi:hypothetical protein